MIFYEEWGFDRGKLKVEKAKMTGYGARNWRLWVRSGDRKEGATPNRKTEIKSFDLSYQLWWYLIKKWG